MEDLNWFTSMFSKKTTEGDIVAASVMNVTKKVSIVAGLVAGLTTMIDISDPRRHMVATTRSTRSPGQGRALASLTSSGDPIR